MITIEKLPSSEISRIVEIDRSEEVRQRYVLKDGRLSVKSVRWLIPSWSTAEAGDHGVTHYLEQWKPWLDEGGTLFGAFEREKMAGFAIYRPRIAPDMAQLAVLHISRESRRRGVGSALVGVVVDVARADGARYLYVSSIPTKGTVDFYLSLGCRPAEHPNEELLKLEPDDIHLILDMEG